MRIFLDENVYRIPTAIQENLVRSQNTININNDDNIASKMQSKISDNEINYKELSDDESDYCSHNPTTDSVTVTSKNDKTDSVIIESQQERSVEPSVESVHDTVPLEKGALKETLNSEVQKMKLT
ncbi:hypothetical protein VIN7_8909 [Saccharomyces cerevisiae x Saccharomyces kudriavzevii VIN7]|uniref:Uncharacterized protein n=1 Tax=Saccharomyces cerevisiae x Saccharomyces kudriavzevii (strain VIN7) TaxID=1095631 RepID=H0GYQ8_SACCK|nr:hypothetical protein VIN7_8909 [Saccharomyces cerevisiae x Saccharomyces kudriavzevii VIN7]